MNKKITSKYKINRREVEKYLELRKERKARLNDYLVKIRANPRMRDFVGQLNNEWDTLMEDNRGWQ